MSSHHVPKEEQKKFNLVFQARFSFGLEKSEEYQTFRYPYTGSLRGAKLAAADLYKRRFYGYCLTGHVHVQIQLGKHQVASKTFWHGERWSTLPPRLLADLGL